MLWLLGFALAACSPDRIEIESLAGGEWHVLDATSPRPVLMQAPSSRVTRGGAAPAGNALRVLTDTLQPVTAETVSVTISGDVLTLTRVIVGKHEVWFATNGMPRMTRSPADPSLYAFEYEDAIWVWKASGRTMNKLTLDAGLDSLRALQVEGEVILYWTADPMWSGDGAFIAFLTNRDGLRSRNASQGIRVVQTGTGIEKDIFNRNSVSAHTDGVLGEEFVFSSSGEAGVLAVHPRTNVVRKLAAGYVMGFHASGRGLVVHNDHATEVIHGAARDTLPAPATGFEHTGHAHFSPSGERVAIFATNERGGYQLHIYNVRKRRMLVADVMGGPSYGPVWANDKSLIFAAAGPNQPLVTYRAVVH